MSNFAASHDHRLVSLAAGTMLDVDPAKGVTVAAESGFDGVGLWFDAQSWNPETTSEVRARLDDCGVIALDIEPVILGRGADAGERLIDVAAELDVWFCLIASGPASRAETVQRVGDLSAYAAQVAPNLILALEFLPIFTIGKLDMAADVARELNVSNVGVLIDSLHLSRSGAVPADIADFDDVWFPYVQLADAAAEVPETPALLRDEALHRRLLPGEGSLPLADFLTAVPNVPVSVELRSQALTERYPDPVRRAIAVRASLTALGL